MRLSKNQSPLPPFDRPSALRSRNMAAIRSKDTKPELTVRRALHSTGFRFRLRPSALPGRVDLVLPRYRRVVFIHGCFWHGHNCRVAHTPKTNSEYWSAKIQRNVVRDARNRDLLEGCGWEVTTIWECNLVDDLSDLITKLEDQRRGSA